MDLQSSMVAGKPTITHWPNSACQALSSGLPSLCSTLNQHNK